MKWKEIAILQLRRLEPKPVRDGISGFDILEERDDAMAKPMTPSVSGMTDGQIEKAVELFRAALRKHAAEFLAEPVQLVLGQPSLGPAWIAELRARVEAVSAVIVRHVRVDRSRTPQAALDATGRRQFVDRLVVEAMPRAEGDEVDVHFFTLERRISDEGLEKEYERRGLVPADPLSLSAVNEADPAFADWHPNATHWKDAEGRWCCATFGGWPDERGVVVSRDDGVWRGEWVFAGVRK